MKYLADVLTMSRIAVSAWLLAWALADVLNATHVNYAVVLVIAVFAFLTDAFDGICARRWPYPDWQRAKIPWHKSVERAHQFDNAGDLLLYVALAVSLAAANPLWWWLFVGAMVASGVILLAIESLLKKRSPWAEKMDVAFGWMFGLTLSTMLAFVAALGSPHYWGWIVLAGVIVATAMVPSKWDRLTTRPERRV